MENKYTVFISSTYKDLEEERSVAVKAVIDAECFPIALEHSSADSRSQWEVIEKELSKVDFYVLIVAGRYGTIADDETGISYTEREYDYAIKRGIPVLAYLSRNINDLDEDKIENREKVTQFREKVKNSKRFVDFYGNVNELRSEIHQSLMKEMKRRDDVVIKSDYDNLIELIGSLQNQINNLAEASLSNSLNFVDVKKEIRELTENNGLQ